MPKNYNYLNTKIIIERFIPGGQSIGTINDSSLKENGKKIFLWNALPGEVAETIKITKKKSSYLEGIVETFSSPSPHRVSPKDPCFLSTSPWQIMDFSYECEQKERLILESLAQEKILPSSARINSTVSSSKNSIKPIFFDQKILSSIKTDKVEWNYRNKMEYSLYWDKEKEEISLAFHTRGSHQKVPISSSSIEKPEILSAAKKIVASLNKAHEPAYKYQSLLLRSNKEGTISGGLYENNRPHPVFDNLTDSLLGTNYSYSPNGFFQINLPVYEFALKEISKNISTEKVLDLYSGVGTIGLSVAKSKHLTLVETNESAFKECCNNCASSDGSSYKSLTPVHSKSEEALSYIEPDQTVVLDPPRAGCDKKLLKKLTETKPEKIIYLSCNPTTQARDARFLITNGNYKLEKISPYNFFPKTPHIENLIILER